MTMVNPTPPFYDLFMVEPVIAASKFKAQCLALLDVVEGERRSFVVTKHGRPVAKLVPLDPPPSTMGSVTLISVDEDDYFSTEETWDVS